MLELLQQYSFTEIILCVVFIALAIKGVVSFFDWSIERLRQFFNKENLLEKSKEELNNSIEKNNIRIEELTKSQESIMEEIKALKTSINLLIESDKDDIKAYITEQHHHFCYDLKYIDDYSLDCLERRYSHYKVEGGNSFIKDLMQELRDLPKVSVLSKRLEEEAK